MDKNRLIEEIIDLNEKMIFFIKEEKLEEIDSIIASREQIVQQFKMLEGDVSCSAELKQKIRKQDVEIGKLFKGSLERAKVAIRRNGQNKKALDGYNRIPNNLKKIYKKV